MFKEIITLGWVAPSKEEMCFLILEAYEVGIFEALLNMKSVKAMSIANKNELGKAMYTLLSAIKPDDRNQKSILQLLSTAGIAFGGVKTSEVDPVPTQDSFLPKVRTIEQHISAGLQTAINLGAKIDLNDEVRKVVSDYECGTLECQLTGTPIKSAFSGGIGVIVDYGAVGSYKIVTRNIALAIERLEPLKEVLQDNQEHLEGFIRHVLTEKVFTKDTFDTVKFKHHFEWIFSELDIIAEEEASHYSAALSMAVIRLMKRTYAGNESRYEDVQNRIIDILVKYG